MKTTPKPKFKKCFKCNNGCVSVMDTGGIVRPGCVTINGVIWHDPTQCCCKCHRLGKIEVKPTKEKECNHKWQIK
jgi:hypothetical protein